MELWIRSQDKTTLILAQHLDIYDCTLEDDKEQHWWIDESGVDLGEYPSKERALEVLDEIEGLLLLKRGSMYSVDNDLAIYEMPKE